MDFQGRDVVVTGGTGRLGSAVVAALVAAGATCHVPAFSAKEADGFELRGHKQVRVASPVDLSDEGQVQGFFASVPKLWASIHCAGGFAAAPVAATNQALLMRMLSVNTITTFLCCSAAVRAMQASGEGGRIVNVAARPALEWRTGSGMAAYGASKAAVAALTVALGQEVVKEGILVNAVAPSTMDTPANRVDMPKADFTAWPKTEEVAAVILGLAAPENRVTRGAVVTVYGKA
jgi:NAD(P)-dependent dehydrogenase (short-subunit alcohol dehydrogenase family)